jgi:hypothetical protein
MSVRVPGCKRCPMFSNSRGCMHPQATVDTKTDSNAMEAPTSCPVRALPEPPLQPNCHHLGQWHAVPYALIRLVEENIANHDYSEVRYTSAGGNTCFARPIIHEGNLIRVDFCTDPWD